jgi:chlorite dismutase
LEAEDGRQFVKYTFYRVSPEWRRLDSESKSRGKREVAAVVGELSDRMMIRPYTLTGTRADADFFFWTVALDLEDLQTLSTRIYSTHMGGYLTMPHSFLAMTRKSQYIDKHSHEGQEGSRLKIRPLGSKYLFVYPFVKSREWYLLPLEERQAMMDAHIKVGHKYPRVRINTSYSFGLDDQDFVVSFESDHPGDFLDLVMELRETEGSKYTVRDTPIFTGVSAVIDEALDAVGD